MVAKIFFAIMPMGAGEGLRAVMTGEKHSNQNASKNTAGELILPREIAIFANAAILSSKDDARGE